MSELKQIHQDIQLWMGDYDVPMRQDAYDALAIMLETYSRRTQPEAAKPAQDLGAAKRIDLGHGSYIEFERKTSGASGWLLRNEGGNLVRALSVTEVLLVDAALASPVDALVAGDRVDAIADAAQSVLREALDAAEVHPCDTNNDSARAKQLSPLMQNLYRAIQAQKDGHG